MSAFAADLPETKTAPATPTPNQSRYGYQPFGIKPEGITTPELGEALTRLEKAGKVEGRPNSTTSFRWTNENPPKLSHLSLFGPGVGDDSFSMIAAMPDLQFVTLRETGVTDAGFQAVAKLPKLRYLTVTPIDRYDKPGFALPALTNSFIPRNPDRPHVTGKGVKTLDSIKTLEGLDLLDVRMSPADLESLSTLPKLSSLSLPMVMDEEAVKRLQAIRGLNSLTLGHREISAEELTRLAGGKPLKTLILLDAKLSDAALEALSGFATIQELRLVQCGLTDDRLSHLHGSPMLSTLILSQNEISGPGLVHVAKLKLKTLGLEFNNISNETLPHLTQLNTLENLWLDYCRLVTDEGIQSGTLQSMTHLKELRLRGMTKVTDASLADLMKFGHLKQIGIREDKISWESVDRMKQAMPDTNIFK